MSASHQFVPSRILVIKLRRLGDVLLTTPVYSELKACFPRAAVAACVNSGCEAMLQGNPWVDDVISAPNAERSFVAHLRKEVQLARRLRHERFDLVIDLTSRDRSAILTRLTAARVRVGTFRMKRQRMHRFCYTQTVVPKLGEHEVLKNLRLLRSLGTSVSASVALTFIPEDTNRQAILPKLPTQPFFQVHPFSSKHRKNWEPAFLARTTADLAEHGWIPVITGTAEQSEQEYIRTFKARLTCPFVDLSGQLTLGQLGALSERAQCFLGVDTAPMHIAAAVGTPVIAIFGPSSELLWGPWCEKKLVLSRPDLDCRLPCKLKSACLHIACLKELTPEMVLPRIYGFLSSLIPNFALQ